MPLGSHVDTERLADICQRYGVVELAVFGSMVRGQETHSSDVDLLYVMGAEVRIGWEIHDLEDELTALFGRPVDLVSKHGLHPLMRDDVLAEAQVLYLLDEIPEFALRSA